VVDPNQDRHQHDKSRPRAIQMEHRRTLPFG
jgi:hypothetical protein